MTRRPTSPWTSRTALKHLSWDDFEPAGRQTKSADSLSANFGITSGLTRRPVVPARSLSVLSTGSRRLHGSGWPHRCHRAKTSSGSLRRCWPAASRESRRRGGQLSGSARSNRPWRTGSRGQPFATSLDLIYAMGPIGRTCTTKTRSLDGSKTVTRGGSRSTLAVVARKWHADARDSADEADTAFSQRRDQDFYGGDDRTRTDDPLLAKQVL